MLRRLQPASQSLSEMLQLLYHVKPFWIKALQNKFAITLRAGKHNAFSVVAF